MKSFQKWIAVASAALVVTASSSLLAQEQSDGGNQNQNRPGRQGGGGGGGEGRRNFDPEQMRQRMMERYREQFEVKDDAEWKVIAGLIEKVTTARRELGGGMMMGFGRGPGGGPGGQGGGRGGFGGQQLPEAEALQKAIESKASKEEIKTKLAKLRDARKAKESELEKAQASLREVLSVQQEAVAVLAGLLK